MAALAEQFIEQNRCIETNPLVIDVATLAEDELYRYRAERFINFVGQTALNEVERPQPPALYRNLAEAVKAAAEGDPDALGLVESNVTTDVLERTIKAGLIIEVEQKVDESGELYQHGQTASDVQANTLLFASNSWQMRERAEAETRNKFRIEGLRRSGWLDEYNLLVISRTADNMTAEERKDAGFFDTMSCSLQSTSLSRGGVNTESAFVAGISEAGQQRQDDTVVALMGESFGVDYWDKSAAEALDRPILVHKSLMPNGVVDIVKLWDQCAGGTFFGQNMPAKDYLSFKEACQKRAETYTPHVQQIMGSLLASAEKIKNPVDAIRLLDKLSDQEMVIQASYDRSIDARVFGPKAVPYIEQARLHNDNGNTELAKTAIKKAMAVSDSKSCASGLVDKATINAEGEKGSKEEETWHGGKKHFNAKCNSCKKVKAEVGACHICRDCVQHPARMKRAYAKQKAEEKQAA